MSQVISARLGEWSSKWSCQVLGRYDVLYLRDSYSDMQILLDTLVCLASDNVTVASQASSLTQVHCAKLYCLTSRSFTTQRGWWWWCLPWTLCPLA